MEVIKPKIDHNEYKFIELDNKLQVLMIYDKDADKSAAAMTINVGFYNDPEDTQGLAHFLEHMLFMGTHKYTQENYFHKFINDSGGIANAFTMEETTTFFYQVLNQHFTKSLEVFSEFFIDPMLSPNSIERERNAVDAEHIKNLTIDDARLSSVLKEFVYDKHPYYNFGGGNKETLSKKNIRDELLELFNKYYSANLMKLVVMSNIPISDMETVIKNNFGRINNKNTAKSTINKLPFKIDNQNAICINLIKLVPVSDMEMLSIVWQIPNMDKYYEYKPLNYITTLLNHESDGGIYSFLKSHDFIMSLEASILDSDTSCYLYKLSLELTEKGFEHIADIIECIYDYIKLIIPNNDLYDETKTIHKIEFDYSLPGELIDHVSNLSLNMIKYKPEDIIYGDYKMTELNEKAKNIINECISYLTKQNSIIIISSKSFDKETNKTEKWYDAKYTNTITPKNILVPKMKLSKNDLHLPNKNVYMPKDIFITHFKETPIPVEIQNNSYECWYKKDNRFQIPKVYCSLILYLDNHYKTVINYIITHIYFDIISNYLRTNMYYAQLCSSGYVVEIYQNHIHIMFYGFNSNIVPIIKTFIDAMMNIKITEKDFDFVKYDFKDNLKNFIYNPAYMLATEYFEDKLYTIKYTDHEMLDVIDKISIKDMNLPKSWFHTDCALKTFIYGNVDDNLIDFFKEFFTMFKCKNGDANYIKIAEINKLNEGDEHIYIRKSLNKADDNYAIYLFFEIENVIKNITKNWEAIVICISLINIHIREQFFTQLRTREQLGYIVKTFSQSFEDGRGVLLGLAFLVQSPSTEPNILKKRIKKFIKDMYVDLKNLNNDKLNGYKSILQNTYDKKYRSQNEEFSFIDSEIASGDYLFNYKELLSKKVGNVTLKMLIAFYEKYFINKVTRKIRILEIFKDKQKS